MKILGVDQKFLKYLFLGSSSQKSFGGNLTKRKSINSIENSKKLNLDSKYYPFWWEIIYLNYIKEEYNKAQESYISKEYSNYLKQKNTEIKNLQCYLSKKQQNNENDSRSISKDSSSESTNFKTMKSNDYLGDFDREFNEINIDDLQILKKSFIKNFEPSKFDSHLPEILKLSQKKLLNLLMSFEYSDSPCVRGRRRFTMFQNDQNQITKNSNFQRKAKRRQSMHRTGLDLHNLNLTAQTGSTKNIKKMKFKVKNFMLVSKLFKRKHDKQLTKLTNRSNMIGHNPQLSSRKTPRKSGPHSPKYLLPSENSQNNPKNSQNRNRLKSKSRIHLSP